MRISISKSEIKGRVQAPPSKSYTIRGLMCAALAKGRSELRQPLSSDDTEAALRVLKQVGVDNDLKKENWEIYGGSFHTPEGDLFCGDSAATLRFMSAICSIIPGSCRLTAGASLTRRPVKTLIEALQKWGVNILSEGQTAPVTVQGGKLLGGLTELPGDISSQYVSALLLVAPLSEKNSTIRLTTPLESKSYVLMTLECLEQFGIQIKHSKNLMEFEISPQKYQPAMYQVESDWSSASYLLGLGAVTGDIGIENLKLKSLQGDRSILEILEQMGAKVATFGNTITVKKGQLNWIQADLNNCIDLLPTVGVLAALAQGQTELTGIQRARLKESNRVAAIREGLERVGIHVVEGPDYLKITGGKPQQAVVDSHNDHRIAMAFSLLGAAVGGITIESAECVSKTYPEYWNTLRNLGVKLDEQ